MKPRRTFSSVILYGGIVIATLIGAELVSRVWDWEPRPTEPRANDGLRHWRYTLAAGGAGDLIPNQDGHWVTWFHRPYHVLTNSLGFRNVEEPSASAFRILAVGDSQTFGPYLANEDAWPAWTENYLRQKSGRADAVQVFNAGISSYTILDQLNYVRDKGVAFRPNLVVLAVFENDLIDLRRERNGVAYRPPLRHASAGDAALKEISRQSALVSVFDRARFNIKLALAGGDVRRGEGARGVGQGGPAGAPDPAQQSDDLPNLSKRYSELYRDFVALLHSHAIGLAVIFIPSADTVGDSEASRMEPVIRAATAESGTQYLDLTPIMRAQSDPRARLYLLQKDVRTGVYTGNGHLSREGNAVIGRAVADWLAARQPL